MDTRVLPFGTLATGEETRLFVLKNGNMSISLTDFGAILVSVLLPAGKGGHDDVVLGFSTLSGYAAKHPFFGATVGRYANRIAKGAFRLGSTSYVLATNNGANHLHGGRKGFDKYVWNSEPGSVGGDPSVRFSLNSPDGDEGYPGNLEASVTYSLGADGSIRMAYEAVTDAPTPVNLTNHSYFNLKGEGKGDILDHELRISCSRYVPVGDDLIPTGALHPVAGTPFDFLKAKPVGTDIAAVGGYDHCFVLDRPEISDNSLIPCAEAFHPGTNRRLTILTTMPGVQFYSGNFLKDIRGKTGSVYDRHSGFCLETEFLPDSPNQAGFPACILEPGAKYVHETVCRFSF
ncbi:MAG: galactose mutarotase [Spirochaetes bacterium]|nr:galactose mutarotase [Spirochaetota bacterium]